MTKVKSIKDVIWTNNLTFYIRFNWKTRKTKVRKQN